MKNKKIIIGITFICLLGALLYGYNNTQKNTTYEIEEQQAPEEYIDHIATKKNTYYKENIEEGEQFREERQIQETVSSVIYTRDEKLHYDVKLDENIKASDVENIKNFFIKTFIVRRFEYAIIPYEGFDLNKTFESVTLRIYSNDILITYIKYEENTKEMSIYENTLTNTASRSFSSKLTKRISKKIKKENYVIEARTLDLFQGNALAYQVFVNKSLNNEELKTLNKEIKANFESLTTNKNTEEISKFYIIGFEIIYNGEIISEYSYYNGEQKSWEESPYYEVDYYDRMY